MTCGPIWRAAAIALICLTAACGRVGPTPAGAAAPVQAAWVDDPISAAFNDTYQERIALNEPKAKRSYRNTHQSLFRLIRMAQTSLEGAFYDIEAEDAVDELIQAKRRGVQVRLVADSDNMRARKGAMRRLRAAGIPVVGDERSAFMHHKFLVIDGAMVWLGSANLTTNSLYRHNNNALTIRSREMAGFFHAEFERLFTERAFGVSERETVPPSRLMPFKNGSIQAYFSPRGGGREAVLAELSRARRSIQLMTFSLTDPEMGRIILEKARGGLKVEGVVDRWLAAGSSSLYARFKAAGLPIWLDGNEALMHHKVLIIDNQTVITGSFNYSRNAEVNNNEALVIVREAPDIVAAYQGELARLVAAAKANHPPAVKPPDAEIPTGERD